MSAEIYYYVAAYACGFASAWGFLIAAGHNSDAANEKKGITTHDATSLVVFGWVLALFWPVVFFAVLFHYAFFRRGQGGEKNGD